MVHRGGRGATTGPSRRSCHSTLSKTSEKGVKIWQSAKRFDGQPATQRVDKFGLVINHDLESGGLLLGTKFWHSHPTLTLTARQVLGGYEMSYLARYIELHCRPA